jgi:biliverdin reductase
MTPNHPLKVGIVGTGFAAQRRAESFHADARAHLLYVSGNSPESIANFSQKYEISALDSATSLAAHPDLDLIVIANVNQAHAAIARTALKSGKHVIVEYPLAFHPREAQELIDLAQTQNQLLHVEHIELLGGLHQTQQQYLSNLGHPYLARYTTIAPGRPAPRRWTFHRDLFGFPFIAALSRIHRFTNLFGAVVSVSCQCRYWDAPETDYFLACLCEAQLLFKSGLIAQVTYGKGEVFWQGDRTFAIHGDAGSLIFEGETGRLITVDGSQPLEAEARRGLFAKDTTMVLDYLCDQIPLYVTPQASLYALEVAYAAYQSSLSGKTVFLSEN